MGHHTGSVHRERQHQGRKLEYRHRAVETTDEAGEVLHLLTEMHGPVVLYLAPEADGYTPVCLRRSEFRPNAGDVLAGQTAWHTELWMAHRFHTGFEDIDVSVDVRRRTGSVHRGPSLESDCGFLFTLRIRDERRALAVEAS
ncbi:DUF779 domain-containing protein [Nocardia halotolerans]|uniref:DUF779 domain-containing protein n=1 Tax=Nocardia halotolerans TaxID=1755878 RepID=A0ABV8VBT6_9NOCA